MPTKPTRLSYHSAPSITLKPPKRQRTAEELKLYSTSRWQAMRSTQLARSPLCTQCGDIATVADHIRPHRGDKALFYNSDNLQSLCWRCHAIKTVKEDGSFGRSPQARTRVVLVCGPAGSGKSTYVSNRMCPGDVVVDVDALHAALTGKPMHKRDDSVVSFVLSVRDAIYDLVARSLQSTVRTAWIVSSLPDRMERERLAARYGAHIVMLAVSEDECLRRIAADNTRTQSGIDWRTIVQNWWNCYKPSDKDELISAAQGGGGSKSSAIFAPEPRPQRYE